MNAIKCPNCGNKMKAMAAPCKVTILAVDAQWRCPSCNVCGPSARAKNAYLAILGAARLTREWIARMETDKRDTETVRDVIRAWMDEHGHDYDVERANIVHALRDFADKIERKNT